MDMTVGRANVARPTGNYRAYLKKAGPGTPTPVSAS